MEDASRFEPIPRPPGHMLVGNLFDVDTTRPLEGLAELARKYDPIYRLDVPGIGSRIIASSFELRASSSSTRFATNHTSTRMSARA